MLCKLLAGSILLLGLRPMVAAAQKTATCVVRHIVDGDTFDCSRQHRRVRVRLLGIDAPEARQKPYGTKATAYLTRLLKVRDTVILEYDVRRIDRYNRELAYVWTDSAVLVNEQLLRAGHAWVDIEPPNVMYDETFRQAYAEARKARRGMWKTPAAICKPSDFRRKRC